MKALWIEEYEKCGCSIEAERKQDLLGYCSIHGNNRKNIYKMIVDDDDKVKDNEIKETDEENGNV